MYRCFLDSYTYTNISSCSLLIVNLPEFVLGVKPRGAVLQICRKINTLQMDQDTKGWLLSFVHAEGHQNPGAFQEVILCF